MSIPNVIASTRNPYLLGSDKDLGRQTEYYAQESIDFIKSLGKYADNHYRIQIQKWGDQVETIECRITDSFDEQANLKRGDDWKNILFYKPVPNITVGMLAWFEKSTWLGFNTRNIASLTSSITVRRCDNVLNFTDEFNNVTPIPFVFDKYTILNSTPVEKPSQPISLINGYKNAWVQYNELTATMKTNQRFIINGQAWVVRGIDSVGRQYTDERDSVRLMSFVLTRSEEREGDDLINDIADADANVWTIEPSVTYLNGAVGDVGRLTSTLIHNGEVNTAYSVLYSSTDESVITVDENGNYNIVGEGETTILCSFEKNDKITSEITVVATAEHPTPSYNYNIVFDEIPTQIPQWESVTISAKVYHNNIELGNPIQFVVDGVPSKYYDITATTDNSITIVCNAPYTKDKLRIVARAEVDDIEVLSKIKVSLVSSF